MDLRGYDREAYKRQILSFRRDQYTTINACVFLPSTTSHGRRLIAAGYSTGIIRIFSVEQISISALQKQAPVEPLFSFPAHQGAVNCLSIYAPDGGGQPVLLSGGDDGQVKVWNIDQISRVCQQSHLQQSDLEPLWSQQLPRVSSPLGPLPKEPSVMAMVVDGMHGICYVGTGDGGCHAVDLEAAAGGAVAHSMSGHIAGVLGVDYSPATSQLASASEDGCVRLWDARTATCQRIVNAWEGVDIMDTPSLMLKQVDGPPITAVRFDHSGSWLVCSCGDLGLSCMSLLGSGAVPEQPNTSCTPQFLCVQPGEILAVGTEPYLTRYDWSFRQKQQVPISSSSAYWIDVDPCDGTIAVCGSHGCLDIILPSGTRLGSVRASSWED